MMSKNTRILGETAVPDALRKLSTPAIISMLIGAVYNIVDTFFIGMLEDTASLAAASVLFPVFILITAVGLTFGMGAASGISRLLGEKNRARASEIAATAFYSAIAVALIFSISGVVFIKPVLRIFGATDSFMKEAVIYGSVIIGGSLFQMVNMTMNNMIRAEGASKVSGIAISLGALLNIILDPLLMFGLDLGLAGAAVATIIGQGISTLFLLSFYLGRKSVLHIGIGHFSPSRKNYSLIMTIGVPTFIRQILGSFALATLNNIAAPFGDSAIAGIGITLRMITLPFMVVIGLGQGFLPLAGYSYGAGNYARLKEALSRTLRTSTAFAFLTALLMFLGAEYVVELFSSDPEVIRNGTLAMRTVVLSMPVLGFQQTYGFLYQALGRGKPSLLMAAARQGLCFVPLALILPSFLGVQGVFLVQPLADFLSLSITLNLALSFRKEISEKVKLEAS